MPFKKSFNRISSSLHLPRGSETATSSFDRISSSLDMSRGSSTPSDTNTSEVSTAMDPPLIAEANPQVSSSITDLPPEPSPTAAATYAEGKPGSASTDSSPGTPTTPSSENRPETIALNLECPPNHLTREEKLSWDVRAAAIIFGLNFFGCKVRSTHSILRSYGFQCSLRTVILCVQQYNDLVTYPTTPTDLTPTAPTSKNGTVVCKRLVHANSGVESVFSIDYVGGRSTVLRYSCVLLKARDRLYRQLLATADGCRIDVELWEGKLEICALDAPPDAEFDSDSDDA